MVLPYSLLPGCYEAGVLLPRLGAGVLCSCAYLLEKSSLVEQTIQLQFSHVFLVK